MEKPRKTGAFYYFLFILFITYFYLVFIFFILFLTFCLFIIYRKRNLNDTKIEKDGATQIGRH